MNSLVMTLVELSQVLNDLVDAGHGDKMVYVRDSFVTAGEVTIETIGGVGYICIGNP